MERAMPNTETRAMTHKFSPSPARRLLRRLPVLALAAALSLAACSTDEILNVDDPDVALPGTLTGPEGLPTLRAGAVGEVGNAYNEAVVENALAISQVDIAALITDEYLNTETFPTRIEIDQRLQNRETNNTLGPAYLGMHQARRLTELAAEGYVQFAPDDAGHAEVRALSAFLLVLFAENYCGNVPLSSEENGTLVPGRGLTTRELLDSAVIKADEALTIANTAGSTAMQNLAKVIKGRALLDLGQYAAAAAAVAGVPSNFVYRYGHSETSARQNNGTWGLTVSVARFGVGLAGAPGGSEGINGLPFQSEGDVNGAVKDPRVPSIRRDQLISSSNGTGFDGATIQFVQQKYPLRASDIVIADGVEARLIEAEAAYQAGDYPGALTILNALRADATVATARGYVSTLPALAAAATPAAQVDQIFKERAYWLFLTSHRLGDMRRLARTEAGGYGRGSENVFPTGTYHKSGNYGTDVNTPVPQAEDNNPEYDRDACRTDELWTGTP
jgi:hypothetical protein